MLQLRRRKHLGAECPNKSKGTKCFTCGEYGHISKQCPTPHKKSETPGGKNEGKSRCGSVSTGNKKLYKKVTLNGKEVKAVIDSGSDLHLTRSSFYVRLEDETEDSKGVETSSTEVSSQEVLNVNVHHEGSECNPLTEHISDSSLKSRLEKLVEDYEPNKTDDTGVKMCIILKDNSPVYQNPRRLAPEQNEIVNAIISG